MARPVKKDTRGMEKEILNAAQNLFISKGYQETSISDIMDMVGGAKGMFYRCFQSKRGSNVRIRQSNVFRGQSI